MTADVTFLTALSPRAEKFPGLLKPALFVVLWPANGSGVGYTTEVLVQGFGEEVHVHCSHSLHQLTYELDLRGICGFLAGHWGEVMGSGVV